MVEGERDTSMGNEAAEQRQRDRKHIFAINSVPTFLNIVRELLHGEEFNVTTTNFVPQTFDQIAALQPDLILVDLAVRQEAGWDLLERLHAEVGTWAIPVVITSTDQRLLDRAQADADRSGQYYVTAKPLDLNVLLATIHDLIGKA